jgi:glycosyltransferase involved in cell wall biosynthesis
MSDKDLIRQAFNTCSVCVIIPTYNNDGTLPGVIKDVAAYTQNIIVVNDGSSDSTNVIVQSIPYIEYVHYTTNKGKGWALRKGFEKALALGYNYAITIDSDGQHFAKDLPVFLEKLQQTGDAIIIGARNMNQENVPGKSSFGNRFSNFWFQLETDVRVPDTQSGYRLYPVKRMEKMRFFTRKYEFEIEVLVRCAWKGIKVVSVPVSVFYAPKEERITHFRPFKDFARISLLNTVLVLVTFLYIKPRNFFHGLFKKEIRNNYIRDHLINIHEPNHIKAFSVAFGAFMGIIPIWGFQLITAIFLSIAFKLNKALVILAAHISVPPMIPLVIYLSYKTGAMWMPGGGGSLIFNRGITFDSIKNNFQQYLYGSITLAFIAAIVSGILTWLLLSIFRKKTSTAV